MMRKSAGEDGVMTSVRQRLGVALVMLASVKGAASAATQHGTPQPAQRPAPPRAPRPAAAPQYIRDRINELGHGFNGRVGIAVRAIDDGWRVGWRGGAL